MVAWVPLCLLTQASVPWAEMQLRVSWHVFEQWQWSGEYSFEDHEFTSYLLQKQNYPPGLFHDF